MADNNLHHLIQDDNDPILESLNAVNHLLARPSFLKSLSPSRLPSQAASDSSLSPGEPPLEARSSFAFPNQRHSHLNLSFALEDSPDESDYTAPLTLELNIDGDIPSVDQRVSQQLESCFLEAYHVYAKMAASDRTFQTFSHGHQDLVLAVDFNYFGTRMVTASSDHKLKVWDRKDDSWNLVDSWKAHDAEVVDVKWNGPFMGEVLGSIGEDGRCRLWQEDVTQVPMSGNRFRRILDLVSETRAPFMSLDFKNIMQETWLALITRDGRLTIYEPVDQSNLSDWNLIAGHWVCENDSPPDRQEEVGFKVCFHKEKLPCWTSIMAGLDRKSLSLAVAAMQKVIVYRTDKAKRFYVAAELKGARQIIRDIAWANGSMRGYDVIATASKDGAIRIYELSTPQLSKGATAATISAASTVIENQILPRPGPRKNIPSGISAGLTGASRVDNNHDNEQHPGRVKHVVKKVAELAQHHGAVWRVAFSQMGDLLVSTGDDGAIRTWKKAVNGNWLEYAEIDAGQDI
ncbi:WD40 repeat-like protein [Lepidopterella palustris CBS 459.81]|uniref:WD40 repeat-like protein n=1 Tax=Lepidopterella palustris CBS 459.81 TaxID=1314670 RepID=A0A8E2EDR5_9PEZI|nr:WD40 repeat-like protein [Lepidopterella palustris CBS 459.81]